MTKQERLPLEGIRVLDLTRVWAGPFACRVLADFGAEVIKVESPWDRGARVIPSALASNALDPDLPDRPWNRDGAFNKYNRNKKSVGLRLDLPEGKKLFEDLVRVSDVVVENYSARVMQNLGLEADHLRKINPEIIYVGMPGYGRSGPKKDYVAYGSIIEPAAGVTNLQGYDAEMPIKSGVGWPDPMIGLYAAAAILEALIARGGTGGPGRAIEMSQQEVVINVIAEDILNAQLSGSLPERTGNWSTEVAPQGCYPCLGDDRWIAITVLDDAGWVHLCETLDLDADWQTWSLADRLRERETIERKVAARTRWWETKVLARALQQGGVAASEVRDVRDLVADPHFLARDMFVTIAHPEGGTYRHVASPIHLSRTPAQYANAAPGLGEHNSEVFGELLGKSADELLELERAGAIFDTPGE